MLIEGGVLCIRGRVWLKVDCMVLWKEGIFEQAVLSEERAC